MTETIWVALISNCTTIIVVLISRLWSHKEHRRTEATIHQLKQAVNGEQQSTTDI